LAELTNIRVRAADGGSDLDLDGSPAVVRVLGKGGRTRLVAIGAHQRVQRASSQGGDFAIYVAHPPGHSEDDLPPLT
jgi:hypothetical protein